MKFKSGESYRARIHGRIYKIHILVIVDKEQVVFKWYGKAKQWWHYEVAEVEILEFMIESASRSKSR